MKFRILEKRGKFRIEKFGERRKLVDCCWIERFFGESTRRITVTEWTEEMQSIEDKGPYGSLSSYSHLEFDTYKQAEAYIKKHYGLEGVKAIEEPEWRVA